LTEIQAVLGISQLARLDKFIMKRRVLANNYHQAFKESKMIFSAQASLNSHSANHIFPVRIDFDRVGKTRNQVMSELRSSGIMTQVHYIPIPTHPYYASLGYGSDETPNANKFYSEALTIPLYPDLKIYEQRKVIKRLLQITSSDSIK
jgi:dTDP-4-amino-4,6-dideoxygalactose transaminase